MGTPAGRVRPWGLRGVDRVSCPLRRFCSVPVSEIDVGEGFVLSARLVFLILISKKLISPNRQCKTRA